MWSILRPMTSVVRVVLWRHLQSLVPSRSCLWLLFLCLEKQMRLFPSSQDLLLVQVRLKFQQIQIKQGTECWILPDHADRRWTTMTTLTTLTRTHVRLVTLPQKLEVIATCQAELLNAPLPREWLMGQSPVTQVGWVESIYMCVGLFCNPKQEQMWSLTEGTEHEQPTGGNSTQCFNEELDPKGQKLKSTTVSGGVCKVEKIS